MFYDEGGVCVRAQILSRCPRIVADAGLICLFGEIERAFKASGRVPKLVRYQGVWGHVGVWPAFGWGTGLWLVSG